MRTRTVLNHDYARIRARSKRDNDPAYLADFTDTQRPWEAFRPVGDWRKRAFDVALAALILLLLSPLFAMVMVLIRMSSPGPTLYGHERIGRGGRSFKCLKFRTMVPNGDEILAAYLAANPDAEEEWKATRKLRVDPRVTVVGSVLRKTSVDELPQLINILRGEMSLVGPRPVVFDELRYYGPRKVHYLAARPGLTGLWQVSGRSDTSYDQRVSFDCHYCENWTFVSDLLLIVRTVPAVLSRRGTY
ncbi:MAG: sugar transferase [Aurantimonas endophytica]|jgi:exopolysaccharide production protein ExoY